MQHEIEQIVKEQSKLNERISSVVKSLSREYSDAVSDEIEKLYSNDTEFEGRLDSLVSAVKSLESAVERLSENFDILSRKVKYIEENSERFAMEMKMLEDRLSASEKLHDRNEMEEAVRKIRRE